MKTVSQHLGELPYAFLQGIAQNQGIVLAERTRKSAVTALAAALSDDRHVEAVWRRLDADARAALQALAASDNHIPVAIFQRRFGELRRFGDGSLEIVRPWSAPANTAEVLWYSGLITRGFDDTELGLVECISIPDDLLPLLPTPSSATHSFPPEPAPAPRRILSDGDAFLEDVTTLLIYVQNEPVWLTARHKWRDKDLSRVARQWQHPPGTGEAVLPPGSRRSLLVRSAHRAGFLTNAGRRARLRGSAVRAWLEAGRPAQTMQLFQAWRDDAGWNDLCLTPGLTCVEGNWRSDPVVMRSRLLPHLARAEPGAWYQIASSIAGIHADAADFLRPDGNYDTWYIKDDNGAYLKGFEHWGDVEGRLLRFVLTGPLFWLGVVALDGTQEHWSLTDLGAWVLGRHSEAPVSTPPPLLIVNDDFRIILPVGADLYDRFRVGRFCDWEASWPGFSYRITQRGLRRATLGGVTTAQIVAFLARASDEKVPGRVREALLDFVP